MIIDVIKNIFNHQKIGSIFPLLIFDILIIIYIIIEYSNFDNLYCKLEGIFKIYNLILNIDIFLNSFSYFLVFAIILPIIIAFIGIYIGVRPSNNKIYKLFINQNNFIRLLHLFLTLLISIYILISNYMQILSGYEFKNDIINYSFISNLLLIINYFNIPSFITVPTLFVISLIGKILINRDKLPSFLKTYYKKYMLADLNPDFFPTYGRQKNNFNTGSLSPEIKFIQKKSRKIELEYQFKIPSSIKSKDYLITIGNECFNIIKEKLSESCTIELFSSTSRALEIAILKNFPIKNIIISPYEHSSEIEVVNWINKFLNFNIHNIKFKPHFYNYTWDYQKKFIKEKISEIYNENDKYLFIISDVCCHTGLKIDIEDLINEIETEFNINYIIDCAHSFCNSNFINILHFENCNHYVFSTHKWLFSNDIGGILLTKDKDINIKSYDSWNGDLPICTASIKRIAGLRAGLELLKLKEKYKLNKRSIELKDEFISKIKSYNIIGNNQNSQTNMITIKPKKLINDIEGYIKYINKNKNLYIIKLDNNNIWIRITFPFFLDLKEVYKLADRLEKAIKVF